MLTIQFNAKIKPAQHDEDRVTRIDRTLTNRIRAGENLSLMLEGNQRWISEEAGGDRIVNLVWIVYDVVNLARAGHIYEIEAQDWWVEPFGVKNDIAHTVA
jgi:hypothetical protein